jgi:glycosyltransferase involved in cell wall biosynthesis
LAEAYNTNDLANGIAWALREGKATISPTHLRQSVVQRFSSEVIANEYAQLYEQLITPSHE